MSINRSALAHVVAVANGKGGVGKTSLCTTLAGLCARAGYRVLLIDLDPQGNAGEDLGYTGGGLSDQGAAIVRAVTADMPLNISIEQCRPGLDVICGGERLDDLAGVLLSRARRGAPEGDMLAEPLSRLLEAADYDLVLIDCPPGEPSLQMLALGAARWLIIPTRGDAASLKGMSRIAGRLVQARTNNPSIDVLGVVLFDVAVSATRLRRELSDQIETALGGAAPLFTTAVRHSISATESRGAGLLIHEYAAEAEGGEPFWKALREGRRPTTAGTAPGLAADYASLAHEILTRIDQLESAQEQTA